MQKITDNFVTNLYSLPLPKKTLVIILDIISLADDTGTAIINHADITKISDCADSTFYESLKTLVKYGLIAIDEDDFFKRDIKIHVLNNSFKSGFKNYIDTNKIFFVDRHYAKLTASMIRLYLYFYKRAYHAKFRDEYREGNSTYRNYYRHDKTFESVYRTLHMSKRQFMTALKKLNKTKYLSVGFGISIDKFTKETIVDVVTLAKSYLATPKTITTRAGGTQIEVSAPPLLSHWRYYVSKICKKYKRNIDEKTEQDIAMLFRQYVNIAQAQSKNIYSAIRRAIISVDKLEIRAVHATLKKYMSKDFNEAFLFER